MVENNSLLNKLRQNRHRTTVPERDDDLVKREPQIQPSKEETKTTESDPAKISPSQGDRTPEIQETTTTDNTDVRIEEKLG